MASSRYGSESFFDPNACGAWERTYWEKGPDAALAYCEKKAKKLEALTEILRRVADLFPWRSNADQEISVELGCYNATLQLYRNDLLFLDPRSHLLGVSHSGRGEPGRTPFNYPDFRKRFYFEDELLAHISDKMARHERAYQVLGKCLSLPQFSVLRLFKSAHAGAFSVMDRVSLSQWYFFHLKALAKWSDRFQALKDDPDLAIGWLLPIGLKTNLKMMKLDRVHKDQILGQGAVAIVLENGVDETHSRFFGSVENHTTKVSSSAEIAHGTFVSGLISEAAPEAKIKVYSDGRHLTEEPESIINFSGWFTDCLSGLSTQPNALRQHVKYFHGEQSPRYRELELALSLPASVKQKMLRTLAQKEHIEVSSNLLGDLKDSLLIQAIGNRGVLLDQNDLVAQGHYWVSSSPERMRASIFVVSLNSNGLFPDSFSCLPGAKYAASTICAIGSDAYSTLPGDKFGYDSGTSFAAPFVTSVASLIRGKHPHLSLKKIRHCILQSATSIILGESGRPHFVEDPLQLLNYSLERIERSREIYGVGLLNAERALKLADTIVLNKSASRSWKNLSKKQRRP
jgi:hypothetical protein